MKAELYKNTRYTLEEWLDFALRIYNQQQLAINKDSKFSVAALTTAICEDNEMHVVVNCNTEISSAPKNNYCAERTNVNSLRGYGRNMAMLDTVVSGRNTKLPLKDQQSSITPCCHHCLEVLYQFRSGSAAMPSMVHYMPPPLSKNDRDLKRAVDQLVSHALEDLIPSILKYDSEEHHTYDVEKRPKGIFKCKKPQDLKDLINQQYRALVGDDMAKTLPPLNGNITHIIQAAGINFDEFETSRTQSKIQSLLGVIRNIQALQFDPTNGTHQKVLCHVEASIARTADGKVFLSSSIGGKGVSSQDGSVKEVISLAQREDEKYKITHLCNMGDPLIRDRKRQYPYIGDIAELSKRSFVAETRDDKHRISKSLAMEMCFYNPDVPGKDVYADTREVKQRLVTEPESNIVARFVLSELVNLDTLFLGLKGDRCNHR